MLASTGACNTSHNVQRRQLRTDGHVEGGHDAARPQGEAHGDEAEGGAQGKAHEAGAEGDLRLPVGQGRHHLVLCQDLALPRRLDGTSGWEAPDLALPAGPRFAKNLPLYSRIPGTASYCIANSPEQALKQQNIVHIIFGYLCVPPPHPPTRAKIPK